MRTYVSEVEYDSWNRIRKMVYPDGETVTYGYDRAGQLNRMTSEKDGYTYDFITDMTYDVYGNTATKTYGNGIESNYTYDPKRQHLTSMVATNSQGEFINAAYSYDKIDNIVGIKNAAKPVSTIGGTYSHSYTYDDFSRLVSASGKCGKGVSYQLNMEYDIMSNPLRKKQTVKGSAVATSHDLEFTYDGDKPNAASKIGNESYTYDLNGNPTLIEGDTTYREMVWNEENRLMILSDADYVSRYTYDYTGNRVIKSHGPMTTIYINGVLQGVDMHDDENYTLYVSPYMTVNAERFTKYYYAGTQRIASKLGSGKFDNVYGRKRLCRTISTNGKGSTRLLQAGGRHSGCTEPAGTVCQPVYIGRGLSECATGQLRCTDRLAWAGGTQAAGTGVRSSGQFLKGSATRGEGRRRLQVRLPA